MSDLISRSAVLTVGNVRKVVEYDEAGYDMTYDAVPVEAIEALPAIDVAPVVHAEWTEEEQCSNCGHDAEFTEWTTERRTINGDGDLVNIEYEVKRTYHLTKRCPNCGAKMDAKEEANANE